MSEQIEVTEDDRRDAAMLKRDPLDVARDKYINRRITAAAEASIDGTAEVVLSVELYAWHAARGFGDVGTSFPERGGTVTVTIKREMLS